MILDKLENADWYYDSVPGLKEFMKFYNDNDLEELPACKIYLDGKDLFVNIVDFKGKEEAKCRMEAHKDYLHGLESTGGLPRCDPGVRRRQGRRVLW